MSFNAWQRDDPPNLETDDAFGVRALVDRLVDLVRTAPYPFTIALSGSWGAGKTTVTTYVLSRLEAEGVAVCVVDLWVSAIDQLRRSLVIEVASALREGRPKDDIRKGVAKELDDELRSSRTTALPPRAEFAPSRLWRSLRAHRLRAIGLLAGLIDLVGLVEVAVPALMPAVATLLGALLVFLILNSGLFVTVTTTTQTQAPAQNFVATQEKFAELVSNKEGKSGPVLVVVDNIDRLPAEDALTALREIRSLIELSGSRCVFLIPIDRAALVGQLRHKLGGNRAARDFLDKFFNVDIPLTDPEVVDLRGWVRSLARGMFGSGVPAAEVDELAQIVVLGCARSPRAAKRILNGVYARHRLVDADLRGRLTLQKMAVVESVLVRFPRSMKVLLESPRRFLDLRVKVGELDAESPERALADEIAGSESGGRAELARLLQGTWEIDLSAFDIRDVLSLREEREWRGVGDASAIVQALEAANGEALRRVLEPLDASSREDAIARCADWIRNSFAEGYKIFAFNGLSAVAGAVDSASPEAARLRPVAIDMLGAADFADSLGRLNDRSTALVFGSADRSAQKAALWRRAAQYLSSGTAEPTMAGAVRVIREGLPFVGASEITATQAQIAGLGHSLLDPLFRVPIDPRLVTGAVANRYAGDLSSLELTPAGVEVAGPPAARLALAQESGWSGPTEVATIATRLAAQLPTVSQLTPQAIQLLDDLTRVTSTVHGGSLPTLVTALVAWSGPQRALTIAFALRHDPTDLTAAAKQQVTGWIVGADRSTIETFADRSTGGRSLTEVGVSALLANRWLAATDPAFAHLSLRFENNSEKGAAILTALGEAAPAIVATRLAEAVDVIRAARKSALSQLVTQAGRVIEQAPAAQLSNVVPAIEALNDAEQDIALLIDALRRRLSAPVRADLDGEAVVAGALARLLPQQSATVTHAFVGASAAVGYVPLGALSWLRSDQDADVDVIVGVIGNAIRHADYVPAELTASLGAHRGWLHHDSSVRAALAAFALRRASDCSEAQALLEEAREWSQCTGAELDELNASLTAIAEACPSAAETVAALRAMRRPPDRPEGE